MLRLSLPALLQISDFMLNNLVLNPMDGSEMLACIRGKFAYLIRLTSQGPTIAVTYTLENAGEEMIWG
jgi:hypothetical protein